MGSALCFDRGLACALCDLLVGGRRARSNARLRLMCQMFCYIKRLILTALLERGLLLLLTGGGGKERENSVLKQML